MLVYGECECFRHAYVVCFVSCVHPVSVLNAAFLHDLQFVNTGRGCNRRPYRRCILQRPVS